MAFTPIPKEKLAELEQQHEDILVVTAANDRWQVAVRRPLRKEFLRIRAMMSNDAQKFRVDEAIFRACVVEPPREQHDAFLERDAAADSAVANDDAVLRFIGMRTAPGDPMSAEEK